MAAVGVTADQNPPRKPPPALPPGPTVVCRLADLPDGEARGFDLIGKGRETILLLRRGNRLFGYMNVCPHWGHTPLGWKRGKLLNADRTRIVCFAHGAEFDIETGACTLGPCLHEFLTPLILQINAAQEVVLLGKAD